MKITIDHSVLEKFPKVRLGVLLAKGIDNRGRSEGLSQKTREAEKQIREKLSLETLADEPKISDWRNAYSSFGAKPKTFKNSVEALLRRVLKGDELPDINKVVNAYNLVSIKHVLPAGGDDLDKVEGDITLTVASGGEPFTLLGSVQTEAAEAGEVIYRDDKEVLCRKWNWRECDKTKMTEETKNVCIVIEALQSTGKQELGQALNDLKANVEEYCGGKSTVFVLDINNPSVELVI